MGVALMSNPLITTVWSRCDGRLNSETPISLKAFWPVGAVAGISLADGAFALLGAGSVAPVRSSCPASLPSQAVGHADDLHFLGCRRGLNQAEQQNQGRHGPMITPCHGDQCSRLRAEGASASLAEARRRSDRAEAGTRRNRMVRQAHHERTS
jgi:hypothetical protein